ncbi:MAG TPA: tRNA (N6-threonylcarbamoyladenosine(37)-N6)-methyltransferase TrmO [Desulfonatronum sp.]|nr:tRNA (N6-threonylcarbamoyladenosine(37)-N6)-methyltransferase TrmO [Desulfonatronum sp.]
MDLVLVPIGHVHSSLKNLADCPKQGGADAPMARIEVVPEYLSALRGLAAGQEVEVLTWLHLGRRDRLSGRAQGNPDNPLQGVFALRSPHRPNPIGLHRVRIMGVNPDTGVLDVFALEVLDQTVVLDIKPVLGRDGPHIAPWGPRISAREALQLQEIGERAWQRGLFSGANGNLSLRQGEAMIITVSGSAKGRLRPGDLVAVDLASGSALGPGRASTEAALHRAVYAAQPKAQAVVHVHPPHLLALSLSRTDSDFLALPLFEARHWIKQMIRLPANAPGSKELASQVGRASMGYPALFMESHGLVCWGRDLGEALALAEELEGLARIACLSGGRRTE